MIPLLGEKKIRYDDLSTSYFSPSKTQPVTKTLILTVIISSFGSAFVFGYSLGVINLPGKYIEDFLASTLPFKTIGSWDREHTIKFMYAQVASVFVAAAMIGAFVSGFPADHFGRRNTLIVNNLLAIAGGLIAGLCVHFNEPWMLYVGRALTGLNCGISTGIHPMYLIEIAPQSIRGLIGACFQLTVSLGIALSYVATLSVTLNTPRLWPLAVGLTAIPALISLVALPFCPESPRFLYVKRHHPLHARRAFQRLNVSGHGQSPDAYLDQLEKEVRQTDRDHAKGFKFIQLFTTKKIRLAVLIACLLQVAQQLSGINAVLTYSSIMFATAGVPSDHIQYYVLLTGIIMFLVTIVALPLLDKLGRRTILLWPTLLLALSLLGLTVTVTIQGHQGLASDLAHKLSIVSVVFFVIYIICFSPSLGPLPCLIVPELFRQQSRASANALSLGVQWLGNLVVVFSYPVINQHIGGLSFLPYLFVVVFCWIFFFAFMPETKNRRFDDIAEELEECKTWCASRRDRSSNNSVE